LILRFAPEKNGTPRERTLSAATGEEKEREKDGNFIPHQGDVSCICVYKLEVDLMGLREIRSSS